MRERVSNWIGIALIALCFVVSLFRILSIKKAEENGTTIRLAHFQLEGGVRLALDQIAAEYTRIHPGVKIIQIPIPQSIFSNWLITQLVGGTAPDIIELSGQNEDKMARFFYPVTDLMGMPNPYNAGTDLANVPLRSTFFDGGLGGYSSVLLEYFGLPISGSTNRAYYNLNLLEQITGSRRIPRSYEDFEALCERIKEYSKRTGKTVIPMAGSKYNSPIIMDQLFASQTQKLMATLLPPAYPMPNGPRIIGEYLDHKWSLQTPQILSGLKLMREASLQMQPGFMQVQRDQAMFYFVQGKALSLVSGSWDATSIRQQASFPIGIGEIPIPSQENSAYGQNVIGRLSEVGTTPGILFGLTRNSAHPEIARDFLLFLVSKSMQERWTKESGWVPSVAGVTPSTEATPFMPNSDGYLSGFTLRNAGGADVARIIDNNYYLLTSPYGGTQAFLQAIAPEFSKAILSDLTRESQALRTGIRRMDGILCSAAWQATTAPDNQENARRYDLFLQASGARDRSYYLKRMLLQKAGASPE